MWAKSFDARLRSWTDLRCRVMPLSPEHCLQLINQWWFDAPWTSYYLHWDDQADWPDPWQLLSDNIYCSVARALGIVYTIAMLDRSDLQDAVMIEHQGHNLVLVHNGKYMLNWESDQIVNIFLGDKKFGRSLSQAELKQKIC